MHIYGLEPCFSKNPMDSRADISSIKEEHTARILILFPPIFLLSINVLFQFLKSFVMQYRENTVIMFTV